MTDAKAADGSLQRRYLPLQKIRAPICAQTIKSAGNRRDAAPGNAQWEFCFAI